MPFYLCIRSPHGREVIGQALLNFSAILVHRVCVVLESSVTRGDVKRSESMKLAMNIRVGRVMESDPIRGNVTTATNIVRYLRITMENILRQATSPLPLGHGRLQTSSTTTTPIGWFHTCSIGRFYDRAGLRVNKTTTMRHVKQFFIHLLPSARL